MTYSRHPARVSCATWLALSALLGVATRARAKGPTSAAIAGRVTNGEGRGLQGVQVIVINQATGIVVRAVSRGDGRYVVSGLHVGGPYALTARRIGSPTAKRAGLFLTVGQQRTLDVMLGPQTVMLQAVEAQAVQGRLFSRTHMGVETFVSDSVLRQAPIINRDVYDLSRLVPQMSTWYPLAASGAGPRVNSIRIDGLTDQVASSNLAAGALYGGKVIPFDAVKEFQVLFSPYDVRHGGFAGATVNAVTRSGTNELHGDIYAAGTNERLGANVPYVRNTRYEKQQLAVSLGGPIVRDRLLFFVSSELQRRTIPALGPYLSDAPTGDNAPPVSHADIDRFQALLHGYGLSGGSAGAVTNANPSSITFVRLDAPVTSWHSRLTLRGTYGHADSSIFARPTTLAPTNCTSAMCFPLASLQHSRWVDKRSLAAQLITNRADGATSELLVGYVGTTAGFRPTVREPLVLVTIPGTGGTPGILQSGTHEIATGQRNTNRAAELSENVSIPAGAHRITLGVSADLFDLRAFQLRGAYGVWEFASLDSLSEGIASRYRVTRDTGSVTAASGGHRALYVGDVWDASARLTLTFGARADVSLLSAHPPYVPAIDSVFHLRTDRVPNDQVQWSPRLGFNYHMRGEESPTQLRGGIGLFSGHPPLFWLFGGFAAYGLAARTLQCGPLAGDAGPAPAFQADFQNPPSTCAGGQTFGNSTSGEIDVIDPGLRFPQTMRASLATDAELPFGMTGTVEGMYTRSTQSIVFLPLNLADPVTADIRGRAMYGSMTPTGMARPARVDSRFGDVIAIRNAASDRAYDVTGVLRRRGDHADVEASVSYGRTRDVQSPRPVSALLTDNWRFARPVAGRHDGLTLSRSDFDQPLRVRAFGTLRAPWRNL